MKEFNLSDKIVGFDRVIFDKDVKEFIRLLKKKLYDKMCYKQEWIFEDINKLAGEKLIKEAGE